MRFLLLAIALLVISLTPPLISQSTDDEPQAETVYDAPTAVSQEDEVKIRESIKEENDKWSFYEMHFGVKEIKWNIKRRQKDLKNFREMLPKYEARLVELNQKQPVAMNNFTELSKQLDENVELKEYYKNVTLTEEETKDYEIANSAYAAVHDPLKKTWKAWKFQEKELEEAENAKKEINNLEARIKELEEYVALKPAKEKIMKKINNASQAVRKANSDLKRAKELLEDQPEHPEYEKLECGDILKTHPDDDPCKDLAVKLYMLADIKKALYEKTASEKKLKKFAEELVDFEFNKIYNIHVLNKLLSNRFTRSPLLDIEDKKIKAANEEIVKLKKQAKGLVDKMKPLAKIKDEKEAQKKEREEASSGAKPAEGAKLEQQVYESRIELKRLEDELADVKEKIPKIKEGLVTENYQYYYLTEKLKDVMKRREARKEQLKQMRFNWPHEFLKLALIWFILFVVPVTFVACAMWTGFAGEGVRLIPFGPKPYWLHWWFGNREYWCDVKERELGDRNTHQQPYREGPEMWWPLKPWDIYQWIVVKISRSRHDDDEQEWDRDLFLRSDDLQHEILLRGDEYREDAQWDGAYKRLEAHYEEFNQGYHLYNRKDNATGYKIVNPVKMAGAYGPLLDRRKKYRHPDHQYPLYVPPPPPPMRPAKRVPRHILTVIPLEKNTKESLDLVEKPPEPGPDQLVNYDGELVPKRKHHEFYIRLHHRMLKESRMHCYKPWTRKWINDHFANYHERPRHSVTGESRKRGRRRGKKKKRGAGRSTAGRETSTTTMRKHGKKHHRKHHTRNVAAVQNNEEKQALAKNVKAIHKKHCKRYRKRARIAGLTDEQRKRLMKRGPRVLHRRTAIAPKKITRMLIREWVKNPLKRILGEVALLEKKRDARKQKRADKVKANPALLDAKHLKIRARKLRKHQARLRAENLRLDLAQHEKPDERRKKRHARQRDLKDMMTYKHYETLYRDDTSDDPADISEDEEERMNEEERADYDPFPILLYPDPEWRRPKHHKYCRLYEKKKACQKGEKYAKLHAAKHNMIHDHGHLISKRRVQECPPQCAHHGGGCNNAVYSKRLHHEHKRAAKAAQGPKMLARLHTREHMRRHHEMHHKGPHMPHFDVRARIKWKRIKHDLSLLKKWNMGKIGREKEEEEKQAKDEEKKKKSKKEGKKDKKEKKKEERKGPDGQPVITSIPDADGWKMDKEEDEEKQEKPTQVGTNKISVMPNEKLERLAPMPDTPEEATQALTKTHAERTLEDKTQAMGGDLEPPPTTNKHQWPLPPSSTPIAPSVGGPEDDVTQEDKTAAPGTAVKKDKAPKAGPPATFRI